MINDLSLIIGHQTEDSWQLCIRCIHEQHGRVIVTLCAFIFDLIRPAICKVFHFNIALSIAFHLARAQFNCNLHANLCESTGWLKRGEGASNGIHSAAATVTPCVCALHLANRPIIIVFVLGGNFALRHKYIRIPRGCLCFDSISVRLVNDSHSNTKRGHWTHPPFANRWTNICIGLKSSGCNKWIPILSWIVAWVEMIYRESHIYNQWEQF